MRDFILPQSDTGADALRINGIPVEVEPSVLAYLRHEPLEEFEPSINDVFKALSERLRSPTNRADTLTGERRLPRGAVGKRIIYFPSAKVGGAIPCESRLEAAFALHLEHHSAVETFRGQPITLVFGDSCYTPDFLARFHDGRLCLYEVKPAGRLGDLKVQRRLLTVQRWLARAEISFSVVTEPALVGFAHSNLQYLYRRSTRTYGSELTLRLKQRLAESAGQISLHDLRAFVTAQGWPATAAEGLIWNGQLTFDRSRPLLPQTVLSRGSE
ncbi:MAG: TnsA endonuclease N-terminal domain-containing protein [Nevskia sp.]|nr:TnsA endonuclease N-terminal domain-containing protein [Nevskia sp.]